jgi:hypothetical protein
MVFIIEFEVYFVQKKREDEANKMVVGIETILIFSY